MDKDESAVTEEQVALVADGVLAAREQYCRKNREHLFLLPLADYIILLYQKPCFLSFYWPDTTTPTGYDLISTLADTDRLFLGLPATPGKPPTNDDTAHVGHLPGLIVVVRPLYSEDLPRAEGAESPVGALFTVLARKLGSENEAFVKHIRAGLEQFAQQARICTTRVHVCGEQPDASTRLLAFEALRLHLGRLFDDLKDVPVLPSQDPDIVNLFAVVKWTAPGLERVVAPLSGSHGNVLYPYSAQILLTPQQQLWVDSNAGEGAWRTIERPLADGSRAIADSPLTSGVIDFSLPQERESTRGRDCASRPSSSTEETEKDGRRALEDRLYPKIAGGQYQVFYVPVHVGGSPWLALYTFRQPGRREWRSLYHFYRDLVPYIAGSVRTVAQEAYADCLAGLVERALKEHRRADGLIEVINERWSEAHLFYPFPQLHLERSDNRSSSPFRTGLPLPDGTQCAIVAGERHAAFVQQVNFGDLNVAIVAKRLAQAIDVARAELRERLVQSLTYPAHELSNLFSKHYKDIPQRAEELGEEGRSIASAWRRARALAWILRSMCKGSVQTLWGGDPKALRRALQSDLLGPLQELVTAGMLESALLRVANAVREDELEDPDRCEVKELVDPVGVHAELTAAQWAACYLLVAEPIRNLEHALAMPGPACLRLSPEHNGGVSVRLEGKFSKLAPPREGESFRYLGRLLSAVSADSWTEFTREQAGAGWTAAWEVRLGCGMLRPD